jgi:hypothetical protein
VTGEYGWLIMLFPSWNEFSEALVSKQAKAAGLSSFAKQTNTGAWTFIRFSDNRHAIDSVSQSVLNKIISEWGEYSRAMKRCLCSSKRLLSALAFGLAPRTKRVYGAYREEILEWTPESTSDSAGQLPPQCFRPAKGCLWRQSRPHRSFHQERPLKAQRDTLDFSNGLSAEFLSSGFRLGKAVNFDLANGARALDVGSAMLARRTPPHN